MRRKLGTLPLAGESGENRFAFFIHIIFSLKTVAGCLLRNTQQSRINGATDTQQIRINGVFHETYGETVGMVSLSKDGSAAGRRRPSLRFFDGNACDLQVGK